MKLDIECIAENIINAKNGHFESKQYIMSVLHQVRCDIFIKDQVKIKNHSEVFIVQSVDHRGDAKLIGLTDTKRNLRDLELHYRPYE